MIFYTDKFSRSTDRILQSVSKVLTTTLVQWFLLITPYSNAVLLSYTGCLSDVALPSAVFWTGNRKDDITIPSAAVTHCYELCCYTALNNQVYFVHRCIFVIPRINTYFTTVQRKKKEKIKARFIEKRITYIHTHTYVHAHSHTYTLTQAHAHARTQTLSDTSAKNF